MLDCSFHEDSRASLRGKGNGSEDHCLAPGREQINTCRPSWMEAQANLGFSRLRIWQIVAVRLLTNPQPAYPRRSHAVATASRQDLQSAGRLALVRAAIVPSALSRLDRSVANPAVLSRVQLSLTHSCSMPPDRVGNSRWQGTYMPRVSADNARLTVKETLTAFAVGPVYSHLKPHSTSFLS